MSNKDVSNRFFELYGIQHDVEACGPLFADDAVIYWNSTDNPMNVNAYKQLGYSFLAGIPSFHVEVLDQIEEGDRVANRLLWSGTHTGMLNGIPATGRSFRSEGMVIDRIADGHIVERWEVGDMLGMMQQLGVIPS